MAGSNSSNSSTGTGSQGYNSSASLGSSGSNSNTSSSGNGSGGSGGGGGGGGGGGSAGSGGANSSNSPSSSSTTTASEQLSRTNLYIRGLTPNTSDKDLEELCRKSVSFVFLQKDFTTEQVVYFFKKVISFEWKRAGNFTFFFRHLLITGPKYS